MKYYALDVRTKKREDGILILLENEESVTCKSNEEALSVVKEKLPLIRKEKAFIYSSFDLSEHSEFSTFMALYANRFINFKICLSKIGTFYLTDTRIFVNDLNFHDSPVSVIHIQSKHVISRDPEFEKKYDVINRKVKALLGTQDVNFSIFETSIIWNITDTTVESWETILKRNDLAMIFYKVNIDTIISLARILYTLANKYNKYLYFYFVDNYNCLYKIKMDENLTIIPAENNKYVI